MGVLYNQVQHLKHIKKLYRCQTFITELKKLNVTESKIKRIVGHKSLDVTDGIYTHYSPQDLLIEVKKLDYGD